jgi:branched-chain amino acid transport system permease protein
VEQLAQQLVNGVWQGAALALFAVGYTLIFGVLELVNLAHGATYMWGAYLAFLGVTRFQWPLWLAIPVAMVGAGGLGIILDRLAFKPLRRLTVGGLVVWAGFLLALPGFLGAWPGPIGGLLTALAAVAMLVGIVLDQHAVRAVRERVAPHLAPMISSIGASIILISLAQGSFGAQVARFPAGQFPTEPYALGAGVVIAPIQALVISLALALVIALRWLVATRQLGRAIRAIATNERTALLLGINVDLVVAQTFFLSGALAGCAGALLGLAFNHLEPRMGNDVELAGLTVIVVGGMGSIDGAAVAALLVGMVRVLSVAYLDSSLRDAFVFALLILVLLVRPQGILGSATGPGR